MNDLRDALARAIQKLEPLLAWEDCLAFAGFLLGRAGPGGS